MSISIYTYYKKREGQCPSLFLYTTRNSDYSTYFLRGVHYHIEHFPSRNFDNEKSNTEFDSGLCMIRCGTFWAYPRICSLLEGVGLGVDANIF